MLNRRTVNKLYRGFESPPLRSSQNADDSQCRERSKGLEQQGDTVPGVGPYSPPINPSSVPSGDCSSTADGPRSDKQDDKQSDKKSSQDPSLLTVIEAWPELPEQIKAGILAMVQAFVRREEQ